MSSLLGGFADGLPSLGEYTHRPCCSAHGVAMTCVRYRRTHFVEVRPCCSVDAAALVLEGPPAVTPCPGCGGVMGDGDRVTYGRCPLCRTAGRAARGLRRSCWCGRSIAATAHPEVFECAEHWTPLEPASCAPSEPTTPGGVFAATHDCRRCGQRNVDHDVAPGGLICPPPL